MSGNLWYDTADAKDALMQGDLVQKCPVVIPIKPQKKSFEIGAGPLDGKLAKYDVVVLSQSCDLAHNKTKFIIVCPYWPLSKFQENRPDYREEETLTDLVSQNIHGYHVLNKCDHPGFPPELLVVSFRHITSLPYSWLMQYVQGQGTRPRLVSPYREHLSQALARFFMRVGLPEDITLDDSCFIRRLCAHCRFRVSKDANYCENCGEPIQPWA